MDWIRDRLNTNTLIAFFLLLSLISFAGDDVIRLISGYVPQLEEAVPCRWLPAPEDLANNQSLIGRRAAANGEPLSLRVRTSLIPNQPGQNFEITILVTNRSLGTVPFVYNPNTVIIGDNNTTGLGIIFDPASNIVTPGINRQNLPTFDESQLRILGPQQRCTHTILIPFEQLDNNLRSGAATARAYYRGATAGQVPNVAPPQPTPIYFDQGLFTGLIVSPPVNLRTAAPG